MDLVPLSVATVIKEALSKGSGRDNPEKVTLRVELGFIIPPFGLIAVSDGSKRNI